MIEDKDDPNRNRRGRHHHHLPLPHDDKGAMPSIRQISVHVDGSAAGRARLDLAVHLVKALGAELVAIASRQPDPADPLMPLDDSVGLRVSFLPPKSGPPPTGMGVERVSSEDLPVDCQSPTAATERLVQSRMAAFPSVYWQWRVIGHAGLDEMVGYARSSDLTVIGQSEAGSTGSVLPGFRVEDVVMAAGRPALIVPFHNDRTAVGQSVLIAWDGSREAIRAIHDAMPLMRDASRITVLEVDRVAQEAGPELPAADTARSILERHGFQAFVDDQDSSGSSVADVLFERAASVGADLLVAGLFHHSQLREGLFGGVSHELLRRTPIPVLVSH